MTRLIDHIRGFVLLSLILLLAMQPLVGQNWQADLSHDGALDTQIWRHDTQAFRISNGWLSLYAPRARGRQIITTSIVLGQRMRWRGLCRMDVLPSAQNHAYILLCCYEQERAQGQYDYLALSLGGGTRHSIALVKLRVHWQSTRPEHERLRLTSEQPLIDLGELPTELLQGVAYDVRYHEGSLSLALHTAARPTRALLQGQTNWLMRPPRKNSLGIICLYTATRHRAMHFSELSLEDHWDDSATPPPTDDMPQTEPPLMLSEIMANPRPNTPEYLELYNPSTHAQDLQDYAVAIGKTSSEAKLLRLPKREIPGQSYLVLAQSPQALRTAYPQTPAATLVEVKLPRMVNTGCWIALYKSGEEIESVSYTPQLLGSRGRGRAGVALERSTMTTLASPEQPIIWGAALKTAGYATPGLPNSRLDLPLGPIEEQHEEQAGSLRDLLTQLEQNAKLHLSLHLYDLTGQELWQTQGRQALLWGQRLVQNGLGRLRDLPLPAQGERLLFVAELTDKHGTLEGQVVERILLR